MSSTVIYITGAGHSGSTLLDLLLGNHPQITSLGEVHRIGQYMTDPLLEPCPCGKPYPECSRWKEVADLFLESIGVAQQEGYRSLLEISAPRSRVRFRTLPRTHELALAVGSRWIWRRWARVSSSICRHALAASRSQALFAAVREIAETRIVVDSSKDSVRMKSLFLEAPENLCVVHLVRDGRSAVWSALKREEKMIEKMKRDGLLNGTRDVDRRRRIVELASRSWLVQNLKVHAMTLTIPARRVLRIRYEDLCIEPEDALKRVFDAVQVPWVEGTLKLSKKESHVVGGNWMRFRHSDDQITLDEQWKARLEPEFVRVFNRRAGWLNRIYGYSN